MNSEIVVYLNRKNERFQAFQAVVNNTDIMPQKPREGIYKNRSAVTKPISQGAEIRIKLDSGNNVTK